MKSLIILLVMISFIFAATVTQPATKIEVKKSSKKVETTVVTTSDDLGFDKIKTTYTKKIEDVNKMKVSNQENIKKIAKSDSTLNLQKDSTITATKAALKTIYDNEIAKIVVQEDVLKAKRAKLDASYKEALLEVK
jgi:hypothetical protein